MQVCKLDSFNFNLKEQLLILHAVLLTKSEENESMLEKCKLFLNTHVRGFFCLFGHVYPKKIAMYFFIPVYLDMHIRKMLMYFFHTCLFRHVYP